MATAKRFVLEGAYAFILDRHKRDLDLALSEIGKNVEGIEGDVSNLANGGNVNYGEMRYY